MAELIDLDKVVFNPKHYPRPEREPSKPVVDEYAEAMERGDEFPSIVLERGTNILLDGKHRFEAHKRLSRKQILVTYATVPDDIPIVLYAASFQRKHGQPLRMNSLKALFEESAEADEHFNPTLSARECGISDRTARGWVAEIAGKHTKIRNARIVILDRMGWTQERIAKKINFAQKTVSEVLALSGNGNSAVSTKTFDPADEQTLHAACTGLGPKAREVALAIRDEAVFSQWTPESQVLVKQLEAGETVLTSTHESARSTDLLKWNGLTHPVKRQVNIGKGTPWANPWDTADGSSDDLLEWFEFYFTRRKFLQTEVKNLKGKLLVCDCNLGPKCHGTVLLQAIEGKDG